MKFFKLFLLVFVAGSLLGVGCFKTIEETQEASKKSSADVLMEERQAELDKKEADLKKMELSEKEDSMKEDEVKDEDGEAMEEDGEAMEGVIPNDEFRKEIIDDSVKENERGLTVLNEVELESDDESIVVFLVADGTYDGIGSSEPAFGFGCDDFLVPIKVELEEKTQSNLATAIVELLTMKREQYSASHGISNHVSGSGLILANVRWEDGVRIVEFEGEPKTSGVCESPRIIAQIEETAALYTENFEIRLNGSAADWRCLFDESGECK